MDNITIDRKCQRNDSQYFWYCTLQLFDDIPNTTNNILLFFRKFSAVLIYFATNFVHILSFRMFLKAVVFPLSILKY